MDEGEQNKRAIGHPPSFLYGVQASISVSASHEEGGWPDVYCFTGRPKRRKSDGRSCFWEASIL